MNKFEIFKKIFNLDDASEEVVIIALVCFYYQLSIKLYKKLTREEK